MDFKNIDQNNNKIDQQMKSRVENYRDIEGISTKSLNLGLWYVEHRRHMRLALIIFLIAFSGVTWAYTIYGFAYYIAQGMKNDDALLAELVKGGSIGHEYVEQTAAKNLTYFAPLAFYTNGKYDFAAEVKNPNQKWWAEFDYYFSSGSSKTKVERGFILPGEDKFVLSLAQDVPSGQAQFIVENISWRRISQHKIPDWQDYYDSHLNFQNKNAAFAQASQSGLSEKLNLNQLSFTTTNKTAYNYWEARFSILLYSGSTIVGVNQYTISDYMSGQSRDVNMSWPGNFGRVDKVEIIPDLNIMKDGIYIEYEGGIGQEK